MDQKGFINIVLVALIVILAGATGYFVLVKESTTANWQTYQNEKFGFEFKYLADFQINSSGPNEEQRKLEKGEVISGTVIPSYDTVVFSDSVGKKQFDVVIFSVKEDKISTKDFGNLSIGSACDTRWADSVNGKPALFNKNGISVLEAQVISRSADRGSSAGCYYFKNLEGNLIVFNVSGFEKKSDYSDVFRFVGNKILPTLTLTAVNSKGEANFETVNWKTYANMRYGFEFKYPETAELASINEIGDMITFNPLITSNILIRQSDTKNDIFHIYIKEDMKLTLDWIYGQYGGTLKPPIFRPSPVTVIVAGISGYKLAKGTIVVTTDFPQGTTMVSTHYYLQKAGGPIFELLIPPDDFGDAILSTFKFLDANTEEGKFCGGIAANLPEYQCSAGFRCRLDGEHTDAGGRCVKQ